eukprot:2833960-Rhodomonas_salina.1
MMGKARHGDIIQLVTILKLGYFNRELTRDWSLPKTFGLKDDDDGKAKLLAIQNIAQGKQLHSMNQNLVIMLQRAWLKAKGNNRQQERLSAILYSRCVQDLLDGTLDVAKWAECLWLWVGVKVFCSILLLYEGVAEAVDGNFVSDVSSLLAQVNDTTV